MFLKHKKHITSKQKKKKKFQIFSETLLKNTPKQALNKMAQCMWLVKNLAHMHTQTYVMNLWARI
jgi:hypothetical protein